MGQLKLTVGTLEASVNFPDAKGGRILASYIAAKDGPVGGTNQQQLDWVVRDLANYVNVVHRGHVRNQAAEQAAQEALDNAEVLD